MTQPNEIRPFQCTVPAGTPIAAPVTFNIGFPPRTVDEIRVRIPPGPNGQVGFRIGSAGRQIIPANDGAWIIASDETLDWPVFGQINSGAWQLFAYNTGLYPHTMYVTFRVTVINSGANGRTLAPITPALISNP